VHYKLLQNNVRSRPQGTLDERLQRQLSLSLDNGFIATEELIGWVRAGSLVTFCAQLICFFASVVLMAYLVRSANSTGVHNNTQQLPFDSWFVVIITIEAVFIGVALTVGLIRSLLVFVHLRQFYRDEYLGTWSLFYHRVLGPELAVEDYWRPFYRKPTTFSALKFPAYSKTLEGHLHFLAAFIEALRDSTRGPLKIYYLHWMAGHNRLQRLRSRKMFWIILVLYPLFCYYPLSTMHVLWYWLILGYIGFLLIVGCAILGADGVMELQHRARMRALCEFLLDEGGPDPQTLPEPPEIFGSPQRQRWVKFFEQVARLFNWRGGQEE
jgi:hypothetical protein